MFRKLSKVIRRNSNLLTETQANHLAQRIINSQWFKELLTAHAATHYQFGYQAGFEAGREAAEVPAEEAPF